MRKLNPAELTPDEQRRVAKLARERSKWHWGEPATKVIRVDDPLVPDVADCGPLVELEVPGAKIHPEPRCWLAYEPFHPRQPLHIISSPAFREECRHAVKYTKTVPLQEIAEATGGDQADYALPNIQAAPVGILRSVTYHTVKKGETGGHPCTCGSERNPKCKAPDYWHEFGKEHSKGCKPILAVDVSGRLWVCGGSYRAGPYAGITG